MYKRQNKAIEVMGKDFTLRNVDFIQRDDAPYEFAGSLYFNPQNQYKDIGQALVEDVPVSYTHLDVYKRQGY